jgi:hypothetical protein
MTLSTELWIGAAGLAAFGLLLGLSGGRRARFKALRWLAGFTFLFLALALALGGLLLRQYVWLVEDVPVANLQLRQLGTQTFEATLHAGDAPPQVFKLSGDEWQLDARVLRWRLPAALAGLPPMYRLERLSGRYGDPKQELTSPRTLYDLRSDWDFFTFQQKYLARTPLADARWGSAAYLPMLDGASYMVYINPRGGLVAKPADDKTEALLRMAGW